PHARGTDSGTRGGEARRQLGSAISIFQVPTVTVFPSVMFCAEQVVTYLRTLPVASTMWSASPVESTSMSSCAAITSFRPDTSPSVMVKSPLPPPGVNVADASATDAMPAKFAGASEHTYRVVEVAM